ncbi:hypothetical protein [Deinococcus saxicola]|uniref:hypothetical protein n=1 Tax=Deinococcus saxicola TaxID=249406 RepID=UPI003D0CE214
MAPAPTGGSPARPTRVWNARAVHFDRWLALWETALDEHLNAPEAQALLVMASRMRVSLQRFALAGAALQGEKS